MIQVIKLLLRLMAPFMLNILGFIIWVLNLIHLDERFLKLMFFNFSGIEDIQSCLIYLPSYEIDTNSEEKICLNEFGD